MLSSKSTKGCRLSADEPQTIGACKTTGLTSGWVDLSKVPGRTRPKGTARRKPRHDKRHTKGATIHGNSIR